ncbi:hypothetical protein LTS15_004611 [Exophiala xenobiotica]|nr:hypothetical protein LTS15_004611 [Exophiala xenobiotica]
MMSQTPATAAAAAATYFQKVAADSPLPKDPSQGTKGCEVKNDLVYALSNVPMGKRRRLKIIVAGSGISGLSFAHDVHVDKIKDVDLVIYEEKIRLSEEPGLRTDILGPMYHSAAWDRKADLKDKTVALIGNGSSGVQILPAILDQVKKVYVFIRSPTWITAGFAPRFAGPGGSNLIFTEEHKRYWAEHPEEYLTYRKAVEAELNMRFRLYLKDSVEQKVTLEFSIKAMTEQLAGNPELTKRLILDFSVGCRRPTPGNGHLEALCSNKVEVVWGEIDSFNPTGLRSVSGVEAVVDTIICATDFNISFCPRFPVTGRNGVSLNDAWSKKPKAYLSSVGSKYAQLPNVTGYMSDLITKLQQENYGSFCIKPHLATAWQKHDLVWLEKTSWASHCASTYKNGTKDVPLLSLHPGSRLHFFSLLNRKRYEDYEWKSLVPEDDYAFAWLANGFTLEETEEREISDLTWFIKPASKEEMMKPKSVVINGA